MLTSACVATMRSGVVLLFEVSGTAVPHGNTLTQAGPVASTAVTMTLTVVAPAGTPNLPATGTSRIVPGETAGPVVRVSRARTGAKPWKLDPAGNQPCRSTTRSVSAYDWRHTLPPVPMAANAMLAMA